MTLTEPAQQLSPRETEVVYLLCSGLTSYAALTEALCISPNTLHYHLSAVRNKLGTRDIAQTIAYALIHGLVDSRQVEWRPDDQVA